MAINPHKPKYFPMYWQVVEAAANQSVATRHKVGAVVVTASGMLSIGFNGMPSGMDNCCESTLVWDEVSPGVTQQRPKTNPEVIHAERNAIDKMTREGVSTQGSILFVSRAPCFECAKAIHGLGLAGIFYEEDHDDMTGVDLLKRTGNYVCRKDKLIYLQEASGLPALS